MTTYSFLDTYCTMTGPGGFVDLGAGAANAKEGITIEASEEIGHMDIGADGSVMHSLHANKSGTVSIKIQKTSPVNAQLQQMYDLQTTTSALYGQNVISLNNVVSGDGVTCNDVGFKKAVHLTYAEDAGMNEWTFNAGSIDRTLGDLS